MANRYWIKLYLEILDDPKMGMLPADLWRFTVELFLLAGEINCNGTLQHVTQISWRLRYTVTQVETWLKELEKVSIVEETENGWIVSHFEARQAASDAKERVKRFRERQKGLKVKRNVTDVTVTDVTKMKRKVTPESDTDTDINTLSKDSASGSKNRPEVIQAVKIFVEVSGKHSLNKTQMTTLQQRIGNDPAALDKWRGVVQAWLLAGYKPTNISGMLEWFERGIPERKPNGTHKQQQPDAPDWLAEAHAATYQQSETESGPGSTG